MKQMMLAIALVFVGLNGTAKAEASNKEAKEKIQKLIVVALAAQLPIQVTYEECKRIPIYGTDRYISIYQ